MIKFTYLLSPLCMGAILVLGACATAPIAEKEAEVPETTVEAQSTKAIAEKLTQTRTTVKSADGKMICKRQAVVGSNFKRKICATAEQWEASAEESRRTTGDIQRRAGAGVTN